jgi:hypothetical protein
MPGQSNKADHGRPHAVKDIFVQDATYPLPRLS